MAECSEKNLDAIINMRRIFGINAWENEQFIRIPGCPDSFDVGENSIGLINNVARPNYGGVDFVGVVVACPNEDNCVFLDNHTGETFAKTTRAQFLEARRWLIENYLPKDHPLSQAEIKKEGK